MAEQKPIISIDHVSMRFNLSKEKHESLKKSTSSRCCTVVCGLTSSSRWTMYRLILCPAISTASSA